LVVGGDRGGLLADGQRIVGGGDAVVAVGAQRDRNRVTVHVAVLQCRRRQGVVEYVAVHGASDRCGERRVGVAVGLGLVGGRDRGGLLADGQRVVGGGDVVVAVRAQRDRDRIAVHVAVLGRGGG